MSHAAPVPHDSLHSTIETQAPVTKAGEVADFCLHFIPPTFVSEAPTGSNEDTHSTRGIVCSGSPFLTGKITLNLILILSRYRLPMISSQALLFSVCVNARNLGRVARTHFFGSMFLGEVLNGLPNMMRRGSNAPPL